MSRTIFSIKYVPIYNLLSFASGFLDFNQEASPIDRYVLMSRQIIVRSVALSGRLSTSQSHDDPTPLPKSESIIPLQRGSNRTRLKLSVKNTRGFFSQKYDVENMSYAEL